jgi:hypothetical protein
LILGGYDFRFADEKKFHMYIEICIARFICIFISPYVYRKTWYQPLSKNPKHSILWKYMFLNDFAFVEDKSWRIFSFFSFSDIFCRDLLLFFALLVLLLDWLCIILMWFEIILLFFLKNLSMYIGYFLCYFSFWRTTMYFARKNYVFDDDFSYMYMVFFWIILYNFKKICIIFPRINYLVTS